MLRNSTPRVCSNSRPRLAAAMLLWGLVLALPVAAKSAQPPQPAITVRVVNAAGIPVQELRQAAAEAERIFHKAGVDSGWLMCSPSPKEPWQDAGCHQPNRPGVLNVGVLPPSRETGVSVSDSSFGITAFSEDGHPTLYAYVFYGRVEKEVKNSACSAEALLGHVIAHEVGHLLLGRGHAPFGLMSAKWDRKELRKVASGRLWFGDDEAQRLQAAAGQLLLAAK